MNDNFTKSRPPESGDKRRFQVDAPTGVQSIPEEGPTDFASLMSAPAVDVLKEKESVATDFVSLGGRRAGIPKPYQKRSATDLLLDFFTPLMILVMVGSVVLFLLDVRYVYTAVHDLNMRIVAMCFVLGVVALNRVIARDGKDESIIYMFGLAMAIGLYTVVTTQAYGVGSFARDFMSGPWMALFFNMTIVAFLWWLVNRLTHECCVDENYTAGDIGILTGTARRFRSSIAPKTPKPQQLWGGDLVPIDPSAWKKPVKKSVGPKLGATARLSKRHPGISVFLFSVPVFLLFAFGQRVILAVASDAGYPMVLAGHFYVACYTLAALSLLMLSSLAGLRQYFRARRTRLPSSIGVFWISLGSVMIVMVMFGAFAIPGPSLPPMAVVDYHQVDEWNRASGLKLQSPVSGAVDAIQSSHVLDYIGIGVLIVFGVFLAYAALRAFGALAAAVGQHRYRYPQWIVRLVEGLERLLERFSNLPTMPTIHRRRRIDRAVSLAAKCQNPLLDSSGKVAIADKIEACYDALCALAYDLGVPRRIDQTALEFIESFPRELDNLREEAYELTDIYIRSAYSQMKFDDRILDRLRKFWWSFDQVRSKVVR